MQDALCFEDRDLWMDMLATWILPQSTSAPSGSLEVDKCCVLSTLQIHWTVMHRFFMFGPVLSSFGFRHTPSGDSDCTNTVYMENAEPLVRI